MRGLLCSWRNHPCKACFGLGTAYGVPETQSSANQRSAIVSETQDYSKTNRCRPTGMRSDSWTDVDIGIGRPMAIWVSNRSIQVRVYSIDGRSDGIYCGETIHDGIQLRLGVNHHFGSLVHLGSIRARQYVILKLFVSKAIVA